VEETGEINRWQERKKQKKKLKLMM
jgi:hypothetical protein